MSGISGPRSGRVRVLITDDGEVRVPGLRRELRNGRARLIHPAVRGTGHVNGPVGDRR